MRRMKKTAWKSLLELAAWVIVAVFLLSRLLGWQVNAFASSQATFVDSGILIPTAINGSVASWADYDNDGDLDLLVAGDYGACMYCGPYLAKLYKNDGGTLRLDQDLPSGWNFGHGTQPWGDYDADGDLDLAILGRGLSVVYRNNGGVFVEDTRQTSLPRTSSGEVSYAWADVDQDEDLDIVHIGTNAGGVWVNDGTGLLTPGQGLDRGDNCCIALGDYDDDGDTDLVASSGWWDAKVFENVDGTYIARQTLPHFAMCSADFVDYDMDGDLDLAFSGSASVAEGLVPRSIIFRNQVGVFDEDVTVSLVGVHQGTSDWGDYDNDGDPDLLLTGYHTYYMLDPVTRLYENDGTGHLVGDPGAGLDSELAYESLDWGDIDGDGDLDLVATEGVIGGHTRIFILNLPPEADAGGPCSVPEGGSVPLNGSGSDPDGDPLTFAWDLDNDGTFETAGQNVTFSAAGLDGPSSQSVVLQVCDDKEACDTSDATVSITNVAPTIEVSGAPSVDEGALYTLSLGTITDPGDDTLTEWIVHWGDGSVDACLAGGEVTHTYGDNGSYTISVDLTDEDGIHSGAGSLALTVTNVAPTIEISGAASVDEGALYMLLLGTITDPGEDTVTECVVHWGDGSTDTCGAGGEFSHTYGDNGSYTISVDLTDEDGIHSGAGSLDLTVTNVAPTIAVLGDGSVAEGALYTLTLGTITDPGEDAVTDCVVHWGDGSTDTCGAGGEFSHTYGDNGSYTISVDLTDEDGIHSGAGSLDLTVTNVAPTVGDITAPIDPIQVCTPIEATADFSDPGTADTHTAVWDWGDGTTSAGVISEVNGSGSVSGSHTYTTPGVYTVKLIVTDDDSDSGESVFQYVVVYDPEGGFVTGGAWIWSPQGSYMADPTLEGKATFGFVSKYKRGATIPTGETEFQFRVANLNFHSDSYEWLVVAGARAQYKGSGTINGQGDYGFMLTAVDAALTPSTDVDLFRIKIWDKATNQVVYDNQPGEDDDADLTTEIGGGSIVIHTR